MALTAAQQASKLFKSLMGVTDTLDAREFFSENILSKPSVLPSQVWQEGDLIPPVAPTGMTNGQTIGVIKYYQDLVLTPVAGAEAVSFYNVNLKNAIPFSYALSYGYILKDSSNNIINFGDGNWVVDTNAGVLKFYTTAPANMPPKISFYQYVGKFGVGSGVENNLTYDSGTTTLTFSGNTNQNINLSNLVQLLATGYSYLVPNITTSGITGDGNKVNNITLPSNLVAGSPIKITVNGIEVNCGNNINSYCFFASDNGATQLFSNARVSGNEQTGDVLYWRDNAGFQLDSTDDIDYNILISKN